VTILHSHLATFNSSASLSFLSPPTQTRTFALTHSLTNSLTHPLHLSLTPANTPLTYLTTLPPSNIRQHVGRHAPRHWSPPAGSPRHQILQRARLNVIPCPGSSQPIPPVLPDPADPLLKLFLIHLVTTLRIGSQGGADPTCNNLHNSSSLCNPFSFHHHYHHLLIRKTLITAPWSREVCKILNGMRYMFVTTTF
jgi:hypothetical protein